MNKGKAVALLSGGLDSVVSMVAAMASHQLEMALFFDYGQRARERELKASQSISGYYNIPHQVITLDWLKEITSTALVNSKKDLPEYSEDKLSTSIDILQASASAVWVPNRNGVILNIAASIAESMNCQTVIFGANIEEAATFPDNTKEFANALTKALSYSTANKVQIATPLANKTKTDIVVTALMLKVPLELLWSCYSSQEKHCGKCESCARLKRALLYNNQSEIWEKL